MTASTTVLPTQIMLATSNDDRFPPDNMLDASNTSSFFLTTGIYPQEILFNFTNDAAANIAKITLLCHGIKKLRIERCTEKFATVFEPLVDCGLQPPQDEGQLQRETFQINKTAAGQGTRFVKLVIVEGYEPFASLHLLQLDGDLVVAATGSAN